MSAKLNSAQENDGEIPLSQVAKEVLGNELNDMIEEIDLRETIPPKKQREPTVSLTVIGNRISYTIRGSITKKKAMIVLTGTGGIGWIVSHYLIPLLTR